MQTDLELAQEILDFLEKHAKTAGNYDPDFDEPGDRFNGPDSAVLWNAAHCLLAGIEAPLVDSQFGQGCYRPINDKKVKEKHDVLVSNVNKKNYEVTVVSKKMNM